MIIMSGLNESAFQINFSMSITPKTGEVDNFELQVYKGDSNKNNAMMWIGLDRTRKDGKEGYPINMKGTDIAMLKEYFF